MVYAYYDCRLRKRSTTIQLRFEAHLESNLMDLALELWHRTYRPGRSICFGIDNGNKYREVWAADFRDRIVHHLFYNEFAPYWLPRFIADSCACIPGRGTLYAVERAQRHIRSQSQNWTVSAWYLKIDLANCFVSIDKRRVFDVMKEPIRSEFWLWLLDVILFHDPRTDYEIRGNPKVLAQVPAHKRLLAQDADHGLAIGNLSSQFFLNCLMNRLDQYIKHGLRIRHYVRYVDDGLIVAQSPQYLNAVLFSIREFLPELTGLALNDSKTIIQPVYRGVDFVGQVITPKGTFVRRRNVARALRVLRTCADVDIMPRANAYLGLFRQASKGRGDRIRLCRVLRRRGRMVNIELTKTYRSATS